METVIEKAIKNLTEKVSGDVKAHDALQYTQAALNLAHVKAVLSNISK